VLNIKLTVHYTDGREVEVTAGPATQVAFEREHNTSIVSIASDPKMTFVYWLAWHASKPGVDFDAWLESLESIDIEVDVPDPTKPAAQAG
jgi:hypothetical protein